jgi:hypothetical protein
MSQVGPLQIMQLTCIHQDPVSKPRANYQHFVLLGIPSVPQEKADAVYYPFVIHNHSTLSPYDIIK